MLHDTRRTPCQSRAVLLLRDVRKSDLPALRSLARVLNSVNLPADERALSGIIERSVRSFSGRIVDPWKRSYVFVLEDTARRRVLGTSMVIAKHGTRESPCTFLDVTERENYSSTLDRHFRHQVLSIGFHFDGPTEIGGLVVDPKARGSQAEPGKQLSFVRFLYMAIFPDRFRETVLAELMPPLRKDGKSLFWEGFGRRFTGLDYQEADKLSRKGKEFIQQLFPAGEFYATLPVREPHRPLRRGAAPRGEALRGVAGPGAPAAPPGERATPGGRARSGGAGRRGAGGRAEPLPRRANPGAGIGCRGAPPRRGLPGTRLEAGGRDPPGSVRLIRA
jgi:hypothetical protein